MLSSPPQPLRSPKGMQHFEWGDILILVCGRFDTFDNDDTMSHLRSMIERRKVAMVTVVEEGSTPLNPGARTRIKRSLAELGQNLLCTVTQIEGAGFAGGIALSIASGMMMTKNRIKGQVSSVLTRDSSSSARHLIRHVPALQYMGEEDVVAAIEHARMHAEVL